MLLVRVAAWVIVHDGWNPSASVQGTWTVYTVLEVRLVSHPVKGAGHVVTEETQLCGFEPTLFVSALPASCEAMVDQ